MGHYPGGQAELLRVPYGDFNCLRLPPDSVERENDYAMLADIWPTGYHATELAGVQPGDSVVVWGAGPVGLPKGPDKLSKEGKMAFDFGTYFTKGLRSGTGQANVKAYNRQLGDLIAGGRAEPSFLVSHELPLGKAPEAYAHFDNRDEGWTKVVLKP